ncbi:hypothetical protein CYY_002652 [Polysphondylium violaceum]|uniref:Ubiquitinyl hydrolase 1 n=1 Tax=Polysphondylium violaceum TaxID=133409 RepID=A0A8J4PVY6_9MYCE|nr:hypothetical protein CYY_002652 [Polysphondylium violaceum]
MMRDEKFEQKKIIKENWSHELVAGESYNIISTNWLKQWMAYVNFNDQTPNGINGSSNHHHTPSSSSSSSHTTIDQDNSSNSNNNPSDKPESIYNRDLIEGIDSEGEFIISKKVLEKDDYEIIPNRVWTLLEGWYKGGPEIKRKCIELGLRNEKIVEVKPMILNIKYSQSLYNLLNINKSSSSSSSTATVQQQFKDLPSPPQNGYDFIYQKSRKSTLLEFKEYICKKENIDSTKLIIYNNNPQKSKPIKKYFETLEDLKFESVNNLYLDMDPSSSKDHKFFGKVKKIFKKSSSSSTSSSSSSSSKGSVSSATNGHHAETNGHNHKDNASSSENSPSYSSNGKEIVLHKSVCGLTNLGNTCFMNSSLQCLAHTTPLIEYFLSGKYINDINKTNPLGMKGQIAEIYGKLMKDMWSGTPCVSPKHLKWIIGKYAPQFCGISQQDSQELLSFLLDGLHEDLNRVQKKHYQEEKDENKETRADSIVATEQWDNHLKRNQSIIVNEFQGQYKSTLVCAKCSKVSITFDPYMFVTLPIPVPTERVFEVLLFRNKPDAGGIGPDPNGVYCFNNAMAPIRFCLKLHKREDVEALRSGLSKLTGIQSSCIALGETFKNKISTFLNDQRSLMSIKDRDITIAYELPIAGDDISRIHVLHKRRGELILLPYVLLLKYSETTTKDLYRMIWERIGHRVKKGWKQAVKKTISKENISNSSSSSNSSNNNNNNSTPIISSSTTANQKDEESAISSPTDISQFGEEDDTSSVTDDESFENTVYPFILRTTNAYGMDCDRCKDCKGCIIKCDDSLLTSLYKNPKYWRDGCSNVTLDWRPEALEFFDATELEDPNSQFTIQHQTTELKTEFKSEINLNDCFSLFTKNEKLGPNDTWYCPQCKAHIEGSMKKLELWSAPKILVIHLKRFHFVHRHEKITAFVDFPLDNLDISKWVLNKNGGPYNYQLYAVSNHMGGMGAGHYTASVKNRDQWFLISDSSYHSIEKSKVKSSDAYVLFYELKPQENANITNSTLNNNHATTTTTTTTTTSTSTP